MDNNTSAQDQNNNNEVQFNSSNIGQKEKPDFFEGRVKKTPHANFIKSLFKGKRKFITIGIIAAILLLIIILILWLTIWSQPDANTNGSSTTEENWSQELADTENEADAIFNSDSETSFAEAINYFDTKIAETEDSNRQFDLKISKASFLNNNGASQIAIDNLTEIDENSLTDTQLYQLYLSLAYAYRQIGDEEYAKIYEEKISTLPTSATTIGG